ncbi:hypothetical protein GCM10022236_25840 [Microlunatus ginsengisoli]|uniref:R3H domain-containing protein n=1 Tax=Microlunatus ginsengisoli TaxID=363863 RepID=A0ABP7A166_9ACTN
MSEDVRPESVAEAPVLGADEAEPGVVATDVAEDVPGEPVPGAGSGSADPDAGEAEVADSDEGQNDESDADANDADGNGEDSPLDTEAEIAADYLEELLDIADLDGDIDTYIEGDRAHVSVITESRVLVGRNGEVLDALQELTRLAVMTETGDRSRLMLDVAGYRDQRRKELLQLTTDAVAEVKSSGERAKLSPMNPFERKIVHDAVAAAGLTSESEGEEPSRCVVIIP